MMDAARYERIVVDRYRFRPPHRCDAWCGLEILKATEARTAVIATELADNPGMSITNACEYLASRVCAEFSIDPTELVWIEHYTYPAPGGENRRLRSYDRVTFRVPVSRQEALVAEPQWRPMSEQDWRELGLEPRAPGP